MMMKLLELSKKNPLLALLIKLACRILFRVISGWNELMGVLRLCGIHGKTYESLKEYKNAYDGKRCFIIATGPSLTITDLEKIEKEYTFGMNSIIKVYEQTSFRPTFYGIQDHIVYEELQDEILRFYKDEKNVFVADRIKWHSPIGSRWNVFPLNMSYHAFKRWFCSEFFVKFSDDIYRRVYSGFSITYSLIEIAVYMGFSEIYLLGADCSFLQEKRHFIEYGVQDGSINTAKDRNIAGYLEAKKYAESHGIKIYNATRGGALEVFERVDLDKIVCK